MQANKVVCPLCRTSLKVLRALPAKIKCPQCGAKSIITEENARTAAALTPSRSHITFLPEPASAPTANANPFGFVSESEFELATASQPSSGRGLMIGLALAAAFVLLGGGAAVAYVLLQTETPEAQLSPKDDTKPASTKPKPRLDTVPVPEPTKPKPPSPPNDPPKPPVEPLPPEFVPEKDPNAPKRPDKPGNQDPEFIAQQEMFGKLTPEQQAKVNQAIERGVKYLKETDPTVRTAKGGRGGQVGYQSLAGLTFLECGVKADDPVVADLLTAVRNAEPKIQDTYGAATAILFLDRNGDPQDRDRIRSLAARLIAGQNARGGWTYAVPALTSEEREQLLTAMSRLPQPTLTVIEKTKDTQTNPNKPMNPPKEGTEPKPAMPPIKLDDVPKSLRDYPAVKYKLGEKFDVKGFVQDDNSNTQFAILALWVARRHEVPVARTFAMVDQRFRGSQVDGTWSYQHQGGSWKDTGTCAGLIGLGACRGIGLGPEDAKGKMDSDPAIEKAVAYMAKRLETLDKNPAPGNPKKPRGGTGKTVGADAHGDLYFLWSLERVSVAYHLKAYGDKEWYPWGADILVDSQAENGSWNDTFPGMADTCFALLFLKKANVTKDLTAELKEIKLPLTVRPGAPKE